MIIHYYMQFFPGEHSPGSLQPFAFATALAGRGHVVTVISAKYNIDSGADEPEIDRPTGAGRLRVVRLDCHRGGRRSNLSRLRAYVGFMMAARRTGLQLGHPDVVVGSIQPMFTGWAAWKNASAAGAPFVLEIRDLWPDALVVKKAISPLQARPLHWMVDTLYRKSARIVSLTPGIKQELVKKGVPAGKIDVFPNGFNPALFDVPPGTREQVRRRYGWGDDFVAIYTGSFQEVTAVEVYVRAAACLKNHPGIRVALFGAGPTRIAVGKLAADLNVSSIEFHDPVPKKDVPALLAAADVGLMALFRSPLVHIYFENKLMDYLGAGLPILAAMEGPQARMIEDSKAGRVTAAFDHEGLARLILELKQDGPSRRQMGENGRRAVAEKLLLPDILSRYADTVEACAQGRAWATSSLGTAVTSGWVVFTAGILLVLPALLSRCWFLAAGRLGWLFYLPNVVKDLFWRRYRLTRALGDLGPFLAGIAVLVQAGSQGIRAAAMAALGCVLLELLQRVAERRILTTSWAAEDHRWRPPGRAGKDDLPAGTIPHPSPHPALTINLLGPFVARRPAYDLGALTRRRSVELEVLVGNHTTVPAQVPPVVSLRPSDGILAEVRTHPEAAPLLPGDVVRWIVHVSAGAGTGGTIALTANCGTWEENIEVRIQPAPADEAVASASITRYPGACRAAFAWRGDMDHYDTSTFQSIDGLTQALGLAARYRLPQTMYLSTRLTVDVDEAESFYRHFGVCRGAAEIPRFLDWVNGNVTLQHSACYPTEHPARFLMELGNHMHLHYGTDASAAAGNNWRRQAGIGEGAFPWKEPGAGSFEEQRSNALEARRRIEKAFGFSPKSWAMPDSTKDSETPRAVEAAGCEVTSDADGRHIDNVLFQPAPHLAAGSTAVELTKRYPGDPETLTAAEMIRFWIHRAWRRRIPVIFMCHQHMRLFAGEACRRFTEYILRSVLTDFNGDVHVNTVFGIGDYWKNVLSPGHRTVTASVDGGAVRVVNSGGVARNSVPVDLVYRSGERATVLLDLRAGQESTVDGTGELRA